MKTIVILLALSCSAVMAEQPKFDFVEKRTSILEVAKKLSDISGVKIEVSIADLRDSGIAAYEGFGIEMRGKTLDQILWRALVTANKEGKLVHVVRKDGTILITTRKAAEKRKEIPPMVAV